MVLTRVTYRGWFFLGCQSMLPVPHGWLNIYLNHKGQNFPHWDHFSNICQAYLTFISLAYIYQCLALPHNFSSHLLSQHFKLVHRQSHSYCGSQFHKNPQTIIRNKKLLFLLAVAGFRAVLVRILSGYFRQRLKLQAWLKLLQYLGV